MNTNETCPHCGAEKKIQTENMTLFECGTVYLAGHIYERDDACYERQLAAAFDLLEALELLLGDSAVEGCDEYRKEKAYAAISKARGKVK